MNLLQVSKRLQQELMTLMMSGDKGISAFPKGDNLLTWIATVTGPDDSVYQGMFLKRNNQQIRALLNELEKTFRPDVYSEFFSPQSCLNEG